MSLNKDTFTSFLKTVPGEVSGDDLLRMLWIVKNYENIKTYGDLIEKFESVNSGDSAPHLWNIQRCGYSWSGETLSTRNDQIPSAARIEIHNGRLLYDDDERMTLLALLLENLGIDNAIKLGDLKNWFDAVAERLGWDSVLNIVQERLGKPSK